MPRPSTILFTATAAAVTGGALCMSPGSTSLLAKLPDQPSQTTRISTRDTYRVQIPTSALRADSGPSAADNLTTRWARAFWGSTGFAFEKHMLEMSGGDGVRGQRPGKLQFVEGDAVGAGMFVVKERNEDEVTDKAHGIGASKVMLRFHDIYSRALVDFGAKRLVWMEKWEQAENWRKAERWEMW